MSKSRKTFQMWRFSMWKLRVRPAILLDAKQRQRFPCPAFALINRKDQLHVMPRSSEHWLLKIAGSQAWPRFWFWFWVLLCGALGCSVSCSWLLLISHKEFLDFG